MNIDELARHYQQQTVCFCCMQPMCACRIRTVEDMDSPTRKQHSMCWTHGKVHLGSGICAHVASGDVVIHDQEASA